MCLICSFFAFLDNRFRDISKALERIEAYTLDILDKIVGSITKPDNPVPPPSIDPRDDSQSKYGRVEIAVSARGKKGSDGYVESMSFREPGHFLFVQCKSAHPSLSDAWKDSQL